MKIDGHTYRKAESLAREHLPTWEYAQIHRVAFENSSFPQHVNSHTELMQVMNIMQENRYAAFHQEWGGYTDHDINCIVNALVDYVIFHRENFPRAQVKLPVSTMVSSYSIFKKITGYNPKAETILEIGPGGGNGAFFFKHHRPLKNYSTIEASEAYYLLQNLVYAYNFGVAFEEKAIPSVPENIQRVFSTCQHFEVPKYLTLDITPKATHYPWWRNGDVYTQHGTFDVITSNANLMEFSHQALADYLHLFKTVLKKDGVIICQCLGGPLNGQVKDLLNVMRLEGFGALMVAQENTWMKNPNLPDKYFGLNHGVFVKEGHPHFEQACRNLLNHDFSFIEEDENLVNTFFPKDEDRHDITEEAITEQVIQGLAARGISSTIADYLWRVPKKPFSEQLLSRLIVARNSIKTLYASSMDPKVAIYGAGTHTEKLLEFWQGVIGQPVTAIMVSQPEAQSFQGIPVIGVQDVLPDQFDAIVLSSLRFENEMYETLRTNGITSQVIRLYG